MTNYFISMDKIINSERIIKVVRCDESCAEGAAALCAVCFNRDESAAHMTSFLSNKQTVAICAKDGDTVVGYAAVSVIADEAEIMDVAVSENYRRRGIGRELMSSLEALCGEMGASQIYLEVRSQNSAARALYESLGYVAYGTRHGYYKNPADDAVLMKKNLSSDTALADNSSSC